jgi:hypothetical protein
VIVMMKDVGIGLVAGLVALAAVRWGGAPQKVAAPAGAFEARLDQSHEDSAADVLFDPQADAQTSGKLDRVFFEFKCERLGLAAVLERLAREAEVEIRADWRVLAEAGISKDRPVTLNLDHPRGRDVLWAALAAASPAQTPLGFHLRDGVVRVSTREALPGDLSVTRVYDVRDLVDDAAARLRRLGAAGIKPRAEGAAGLFGDAVDDPAGKPPPATQRAENIVTLSGTIDPSIWTSLPEPVESMAAGQLLMTLDVATGHDGFGRGTIPARRYFGGRLVVSAPPAEHAQIVKLLRKLREGKR